MGGGRRTFLKRSAAVGVAATYFGGMELGRRRGQEEQIERDMARWAEKATDYITEQPDVNVDADLAANLVTPDTAEITLDATITETYQGMSEEKTADLGDGIASVMGKTASYPVDAYDTGTIDYTFNDQADHGVTYRLAIDDAAEIYSAAAEDEDVGEDLFAATEHIDDW